MPMTPALVIGLISAAVGAAGVADTIYNQVNAPSGPTAPTPTGPTPQTPATNQAQIAAASQSIPNVLSSTSGFASPGYTEDVASTATGLGSNPQAVGNLQAAINQYFGLSAPGTSGLASGGNNPVTGLLQSLPGVPGVTGASAFGGGGGGLAGGGSSIVDNLLNQQDFKGFS